MTFFECCETVRRDGLQLIRPRRGATGQYDLKPPYTDPSGEWVFLDAVTANLVCQLCAALTVSRQIQTPSRWEDPYALQEGRRWSMIFT